MDTPPQHVAAIRLNAWLVNLAAVPVATICVLGFLLMGWSFPHHHPNGPLWFVWLSIGVILVLSLHEFTHALATIRRSGFPWSTFKFGFNPRAFVFYCHCRRPVTVATYRYVCLAPLTVIGPLSVLALAIYPTDWLALTGAIHLAGCIGDVWVVALLKKHSGDSLVIDHPREAGCDVYQPTIMPVETADRAIAP